MKISLEWLGDFLPNAPLDPQAAADALMNGGLPVESIEAHGDDTVLDVEVTSNRSDCLCHAGVARELAGLLDLPFHEPAPVAAESASPAAAAAGVTIEALDLCPHYTARLLRNIKVGPSPAWLVRRLEAVGLRAINNVVDVTNYVMFEMGQPLHAFDFDKLADGKIVVRRARPGEKLTSIDGHARELAPDMLVIADARRPVALAGVMGGLDTEVSGSTVNVLLEAARFEPLSVRRTARALKLHSDSSYRFERQIDPTLPARAGLRAAQLILDTAGGELLAGLVEAGAGGHAPRTVTLRFARLNKLLGIDVPTGRVVEALARMHLSPVLRGDVVAVTVPSARLDLNVEVDLIEEVARVIGYAQIPVRQTISIRVTPPDLAARARDLIRTTMVAGGYFEAMTYSFVSDALAPDFLPADARALPRAEPATRKADANLRPSLLPGLLEAVRYNETAGTPGAHLFETGATFWYDSAGQLVERRRLGLVGGTDLHDVRGLVEALLAKLDAARPVAIVPEDRAGYARGVAGRVDWGGTPVGHLGLTDPRVAAKLSLRDAPAIAELDFDAFVAGAQHVPQLRPLPDFPPVRRDLSLVVADAVRYEQVERLLRGLDLEHLEQVEYVTTYRGKPLEKGTKSVTTTLVFRSPTTTLTSEEVEASVQRAVTAAQRDLNATLRT